MYLLITVKLILIFAGQCQFGESCMFSHLTEERRADLENQSKLLHLDT